MEEDLFPHTLAFRLATLLGSGMLKKENQSTIQPEIQKSQKQM